MTNRKKVKEMKKKGLVRAQNDKAKEDESVSSDKKTKIVLSKNGNGNRNQDVIVAVISRLDYGADGSRPGLLLKVKEKVEAKQAVILVVAGGVVSKRACKNTARRIHGEEKKIHDQLKAKLSKLEVECRAAVDAAKGKKTGSLVQGAEEKKRELDNLKELIKSSRPRTIGKILISMTEELAQQISKDLPQFFRPDGARMKIYIVTSMAYDGDIGRDVVKRLLELRKKDDDIRYEASRHPENTTFKIPLKGTNRTFAVAVPNKAVWRSDYYSTGPDRLLADEMKRTTKPPCDLYAVGCGASSLNRSSGEMPYQRITVPALHKLEGDVVTSENMVGIRIIRLPQGNSTCPIETISIKDLIANERKFVEAPDVASKIQVAIVENIKSNSPPEASIGMLEDDLGTPRDEIEKAMQGLLKLKPIVVQYDDESQKYFLSPEYLKKEVRYAWPKEAWKKEVLAAFACLHSGSIHTAYNFFINELPDLLLKNEVTHLLDIGDSIQGLKHDLQNQGEIVSGMNYTVMEKVAGIMIATGILKVLNARLKEALLKIGRESVKITPSKVEEMLRELTITFLIWIGNHDDWIRSMGFDPLDTLLTTLKKTLSAGIENALKEFGLPFISLEKILEEKVVLVKNNTYYKMPSGLVVGGKHYYAGRTATSSTWPQRALRQMKEANLCFIANFHVDEIVEEWSPDKGLRVCVEVPTLMSMSAFEDNKGKKTDFAVGLVKVESAAGRIISSETTFLGQNPHTSFDNMSLIRAFLDQFGVGKWVDLEKILK